MLCLQYFCLLSRTDILRYSLCDHTGIIKRPLQIEEERDILACGGDLLWLNWTTGHLDAPFMYCDSIQLQPVCLLHYSHCKKASSAGWMKSDLNDNLGCWCRYWNCVLQIFHVCACIRVDWKDHFLQFWLILVYFKMPFRLYYIVL